MIRLIPAEIRRQVGRKGSFYGSMAFIGLFALGLLLVVLISHKDMQRSTLEDGTGLLIFATVLSAVVIGATAGAYDVDQGTMRYLVLTGRPRWQLALVRVPALIATIVMVSLPSMLLALVATALSPSSPPPAHGATGTLVLDLFYGVLMSGFLYGILSLAIGTFLKSSGVAIAVAIVANLAGFLIAGLVVEYVSKDVGNALFPVVAGAVIDRHGGGSAPDASFSLAVSAVILAIWLIALLGAAVARIQRAEY